MGNGEDWRLRIKIWKWSLLLFASWDSNVSIDHECMNQLMDGTYSCVYCYPPCKKCGRDTANYSVHCNSKECELEH